MSPRAAQVRIYVDADALRRGKILADLRGDVTYPGAPGAVIHKRQRAHLTHHDDLDHTRLGRAAIARRAFPAGHDRAGPGSEPGTGYARDRRGAAALSHDG